MNNSYIKEVYADDYDTIQQSIIIDCYLDKQSNGLYSKVLREQINPNLHLVKREYIKKEKKDGREQSSN